ncbi:PHP domain-containing protein [Streptomyces chiangmaiensis]|uniref:PHP domain-containing protein n=1 Tax=Streptomyces chiangmaiensis TaxID=766497 RepID=UPI00336CCB59
MGGFTHLNAASGFSTRFGAAHPEQLVQRAAERGMSALALTDRDAVTGAVRFAQAALEHDIRPIFGINLAVARSPPPPPGACAPRSAAAPTCTSRPTGSSSSPSPAPAGRGCAG